MKHYSHDAKRAAFWLVLASMFAMGLLLLFYVPTHRISGALAFGVLAVLVIKHVGLLLIVGSPLVGMFNVARVRFKRLWSRGGDKAE